MRRPDRIATRMVAELVRIVRQAHPHVQIAAHTPAVDNDHTAVLKQAGFLFISAVKDPLGRPAWLWRFPAA